MGIIDSNMRIRLLAERAVNIIGVGQRQVLTTYPSPSMRRKCRYISIPYIRTNKLIFK
jgi:hypothetical protein